MLEFTRLKGNLKKSTDGFRPFRLALLCDFSSQHLHTAIKGRGIDRGLALQIFEAEYNQIEGEIFNAGSALYAAQPQAVLLAKSSYKLLDEFYATPVEERAGFAEQKMAALRGLLSRFRQQSAAPVIFANFQELNDAVFGSFAANLSSSFLYQVRKLNLLLMEEAQTVPGLYIADVQSLTTTFGLATTLNPQNLVRADMIWSLEFLPPVANLVVGLIEALNGAVKKCLVLDLDNTLWGGVIGDDGLEGIQLGELGIGKAFVRLQKWVKELRRRGVLICVCSKNNESTAKEVFQKHPDSVLRLEDIAVFAANWNNKVDNLHAIRQTLNIGFDAMVFVDDNPFERGMVREAIPAITVPELPDDPVEYISFLQALNLFETVSYTAEDAGRTALYQREAERVAQQSLYKDEESYLQSLGMTASIRPLDTFSLPRAAQLSQRSNQFNLRTVRYSESSLQSLAASPDAFVFTVSLRDKFGDHGLIALVALRQKGEELFIENWMMSCRVLKRTVEEATLNHILGLARENHCRYVTGEYLATPKNSLVKDHYKNLGFEEKEGLWTLKVAAYNRRRTFIQTAAVNEPSPLG